MADRTGIEWTDSTFNPWIGCTKISPACDHCYAAVSRAVSALGVEWGAGQPRRRTSVSNWKLPLSWNATPFWTCESCGWRGAEKRRMSSYCPSCCAGVLVPARRRVFCASLADVFDNEVDPTWRDDLFHLIQLTPNLDWLLLTKRIGNVANMLPVPFDFDKHYPNVWLGATVCNQAEAERDIPKLLGTSAAVRFLSIEPLLGDINLWPSAFLPCHRAEHMRMDPTTGAYECCRECDFTGVGNEIGIDWVISGGESGGSARPMHPAWVRSLRDQCAAAGVPFLFKQWGEYLPADADECDPGIDDSRLRWSDGTPWDRYDGQRGGVELMARVGKKAAGRVLDGREHTAYPEPRA